MNPPDNLEILNIVLQIIATVALLPILFQQADLMVRYWANDENGLRSVRVMIVIWCSVLTIFGAWRIFYWFYFWFYDRSPEYSWVASFLTSFLFMIAAVPSLIAFWRRQRVIDQAIRTKLMDAGLLNPLPEKKPKEPEQDAQKSD